MAWLGLETKIQLHSVLAAGRVPVFLGLSAEGGSQAHLCVDTCVHVDTHRCKESHARLIPPAPPHLWVSTYT